MGSSKLLNPLKIGLSAILLGGFGLEGLSVVFDEILPRAEARALQPVRANEFREFIQLENGKRMWVEADIIDPKRPTKIIFNGLTNSASHSFQQLSRELLKDGVNVIRFDFQGQSKTLLANLPMDEDLNFTKQAGDAVELLPLIKARFGLQGRIDAIGQSYGGGMILSILGLHPQFAKEFFDSVTVFAPYTEPLRTTDEDIRKEMNLTRMMFPFWVISDEELYTKIFHRKVLSTYWIFEPEILGMTPAGSLTYLEGIFAMANGIRPLNAVDLIKNMPDMPIHVVMAVSDQYIPGDVIPKFWDALPESKRGYFIKVYESEHKIFQFAPEFTAQLSRITAEASAYPLGSSLEAHNFTKNIYLGDSSRSQGTHARRLFRHSTCENVFR